MSDPKPLSPKEEATLRAMGYDDWMATDSTTAVLLTARLFATLDAVRARSEKAARALQNIASVADTLSPQEFINVCAGGLGIDLYEYSGECAPNRSLVELHARIAELEAKVERWQEREASCCPEDCGFDEVIVALRTQVRERDGALTVARRAIENAYESIGNLPSGVDDEADPANHSPDDMAAHIGGLVRQELASAFAHPLIGGAK